MILDVNKIDNFTITNIPDTELEIKTAAVENQINSKEKSKAHYDKTHHRTYTFKENDKVILCDSYAKNTSKRLCKNFKGPYKIIQIHNNQTATLEIGNKLKTYHFNQLKPFYELSENTNEQNDSDMDIDYDPSLDDQVLATANDFKITAINESSGILFQDLGQVKLSNEVYTLLTFINLTHINEKITILNNYYSISKDICNLARSSHISNDCYNQLKYIRTKLNSIQSLFNIVAHKIDTYTTRHKRGLINGISYATKWLFGIPNSDDANFYSDSVNQLINNQNKQMFNATTSFHHIWNNY
ncbi:hypothetical protein HHI36_001202 [Cryptolaemus montrouzieri]|uniref:Uncharacterized protein n=1 Tax=Cryptolaemus montrouzieri TaxID=559131 RepID=A0ABD2P7M8_9CUCU